MNKARSNPVQKVDFDFNNTPSQIVAPNQFDFNISGNN
jgi:hypothetical protein